VAQQPRKRIHKWDYMKLKSFQTTKETVSKLKRMPTDGRKSLPAKLTRDLKLEKQGAQITKLPKKSMTQGSNGQMN
jgi:hypothetical protein